MANSKPVLNGEGNEVRMGDLYSVGEGAIALVTGVGNNSYTATSPLPYTPRDEDGLPLDFNRGLARNFMRIPHSRISILMNDSDFTGWLNRETKGRKELGAAVARSLEVRTTRT